MLPEDQAVLPEDQAVLPEDQPVLPQDQAVLTEDQATRRRIPIIPRKQTAKAVAATQTKQRKKTEIKRR